MFKTIMDQSNSVDCNRKTIAFPIQYWTEHPTKTLERLMFFYIVVKSSTVKRALLSL